MVCRFEHCVRIEGSYKVCILLCGYQSDVPRTLGVGVVTALVLFTFCTCCILSCLVRIVVSCLVYIVVVILCVLL